MKPSSVRKTLQIRPIQAPKIQNQDQLECFIADIRPKRNANSFNSKIPRVISPMQFRIKQQTRCQQKRKSSQQVIQQSIQNEDQNEKTTRVIENIQYFDIDIEKQIIINEQKVKYLRHEKQQTIQHIMCNFYIIKKKCIRSTKKFERNGIFINIDEIAFKSYCQQNFMQANQQQGLFMKYMQNFYISHQDFNVEWFKLRINITAKISQQLFKFISKSIMQTNRNNGVYC